MEIIILIIIVIVYCLALDVSLNYIMFAGGILLCIFSGILTLSFLYCSICLLFSKRKEAKFIRMDRTKRSRYQVAYYLVEGTEYPCIFPKEAVWEDKLYNKDKIYHVMLNKKIHKVYDRFAVTTCIVGLLFGMGLSLGSILMFL